MCLILKLDIRHNNPQTRTLWRPKHVHRKPPLSDSILNSALFHDFEIFIWHDSQWSSQRHLAEENVRSRSAYLLNSSTSTNHITNFPNQILCINAILPIICRVGLVWSEECFFPIKSQAFLSSDCGRHFDGRKNSLIPSCCWWDSGLWHQHPWTLYLMPWYPLRCNPNHRVLGIQKEKRAQQNASWGRDSTPLWFSAGPLEADEHLIWIGGVQAGDEIHVKKLIISSWTSIILGDTQRKQRDHLPVILTC